ncbi:MAG: hypothetical protein M3Q89_04565, partial [Verrucomicrobiota bacterium]|nr:hypothetical protein [Verrucomicrobiota bacterium]
RQDKFRKRIAAFQHAEALDPRDKHSLGLLWSTFRAVRDWPEAIRTGDRLKAVLLPEDQRYFFWGHAFIEFRMRGVLDPLKKAIAEAPIGTAPGVLSLVRYQLAMLERDFPAAERFLRETPAEVFEDWRTEMLGHKSMEEALLAVARGADSAVVERALLMARQECETRLAKDPTAIELHGFLGLIDAFRGRKEDAIREGQHRLELENNSMLEKNAAAANLALIYARAGEPDEAIRLIEKLLTVPADLAPDVFSMTQADLKWRWVWDPLRDDPRFQKILEGPEPKTIY